MTNCYTLKTGLLCALFALITSCQSSIFAQVSLTATGGTPAGSYTTVSDAFTAINAGTHTGSIVISIDGNTTEPAAPVYLLASGQGGALFSDVLIKPSVVATISGATTAGSAVINMDGADNVTIDGSITIGGTTRDLTIQNTAATTIANVACIRLVGRTTLGLGATNITIENCNIMGSTPGNNGSSGSTITTSYGIYAGSTTLTTMAATTGGADYDGLTITNNSVTNAYIGICVIGLVASQADNLVINDNTIGSITNRIGFKGFTGQHLVGGNFTNNTVTDIEANTSISVAGVDVAGSATNGFQILRNTISDIHQFNAGGYGAYGINVAAGTGVVVANNAISGMLTVNYNSVSTTFQAFGIRLAGGTGHMVYYNSVNLYGDNTINAVKAYSSAFVVTSATVTGLDIRNNVFANSHTTTAPAAEFFAVWFPATYNFANAILDNNAYMVTNDALHYVGKLGTTSGANNHVDLNAWRLISQVGNPTNDVLSFPGSGNSNAPFTSNSDLTIPAATSTVLESGAVAIASLGLPNVDRINVSRPPGSTTRPPPRSF